MDSLPDVGTMPDLIAETLFTLQDHYHVTPIGLLITGEPTFDDWVKTGKSIASMVKAGPWAWGDWVLSGEHDWGEMYAQAIDETDYALQSLQDYVWVCRAWPILTRYRELSFSHHRVLAPDTEAIRNVMVPLAIQYRWSAALLREARDNYLDGNGPYTDAELQSRQDGDTDGDDRDDLADDPRGAVNRPRLVVATSGAIVAMDDQTVTIKLDQLPKTNLKPGAMIYARIVTLPDGENEPDDSA